jgi:hypothetical protein
MPAGAAEQARPSAIPACASVSAALGYNGPRARGGGRGKAAPTPAGRIGSVHAAAGVPGAGHAIAQTHHFILDFELFALEAAEKQLIWQGPVQFGVDLLLEKGMLVTEAFDVFLRGHPFAILRLESLTTVTI